MERPCNSHVNPKRRHATAGPASVAGPFNTQPRSVVTTLSFSDRVGGLEFAMSSAPGPCDAFVSTTPADYKRCDPSRKMFLQLFPVPYLSPSRATSSRLHLSQLTL